MTDVREQLQRAQAGDKEARNYLVQENIGLVKHIVSRYTARGVEKEDLFQIGMIGLLKAIDYFDLSYEVRFSTYAVPMIAGEIRRFMRDNGAIKVSRSIKDNRAAVNRSREQLLEKLGREPTLSEIVKDVGMSMLVCLWKMYCWRSIQGRRWRRCSRQSMTVTAVVSD